ncbi:MAG: AroM family protein [SAR324 cluster bacterium]|jgi:protein AroM|nr:AroM family protein [SAR324 cluster bacterium]
MVKLGALVIGQSPRREVEEEIRMVIGEGFELDLRGALDGLTKSEICELTPESDQDAMFTRLPDGSGVKISKKAVTRYGTNQLADLLDSGADYVMVLCTGEFPEWTESFRVVYPSRIVKHFVNALLDGGRLGVFVPLREQLEKAKKQWTSAGYDAVVEPLSPNASEDDCRQAGDRMVLHDPDLMVFDCISYRSKTKRFVCSVVKKPAILAITASARCIMEMISDKESA